MTHYINEPVLKEFISELEALGLKPAYEWPPEMTKFISLEYPYEEDLQKKVVKLFNKYIGFWKCIAIESNHNRDLKICRFKIPMKFVTGTDISRGQLLQAAKSISQKIGDIVDENPNEA